MEQLEEKVNLVLSRLDELEKKIDKILEEVKYTDEHALRDYLLNVGGDVTGDIIMALLKGQ